MLGDEQFKGGPIEYSLLLLLSVIVIVVVVFIEN